jgi:Na+/proline symporter
MTLWLSELPLWLSALLIVVVMTGLTMVGPYLVRRIFGLDRLITNNEVAGFKFAVLGVIYAVLLGFAVIVVWERFRDAGAAVTEEAAAAASIYRLSPGVDAAHRPAIDRALSLYLESAGKDDWPAMDRGEISPVATQALTDIYTAVLAVSPNNTRDEVVMQAMLSQLSAMTEGRRARFELAGGIVPGVLWLVLFFGALLTLSFTFFFGAKNLFAQTLMAGMLAAVIFMALFMVVALDHPFSGGIRVSPEPLDYVLHTLAPAGPPQPAG